MSITATKPTSDDPSETQPTANTPSSAPWMAIDAFPAAPDPSSYGYRQGKRFCSCSQQELISHIKSDSAKIATLVWSPDSPYLVPPKQVPWLLESVQARDLASHKNARRWALIYTFFWGILPIFSNFNLSAISSFQIFLAVTMGIIPFIEHSWKIYRLQRYTPESMLKDVPDERYLVWLGRARTPWTWALALCIACVGAGQLFFGLSSTSGNGASIAAAGIVKDAVRAGQWWRLLSGTLLHVNILHFLFNITSLIALGKIIESTFHRAYVPLVFVISALCGSLCSLILLPSADSVGASGGIMGMLGFALAIGWQHRRDLPRTLYRDLVLSAVYTFAAGAVAFQVIDNPAHAGGMAAGLALGAALVYRRNVRIQGEVSPLIRAGGIAAGGIILATAIWSLAQMAGW